MTAPVSAVVEARAARLQNFLGIYKVEGYL